MFIRHWIFNAQLNIEERAFRLNDGDDRVVACDTVHGILKDVQTRKYASAGDIPRLCGPAKCSA
jgi:hypothetical protein